MSDPLVQRTLSLFEAEIVKDEAQRRAAHRSGVQSERLLSDESQHVGMMGEFAFGKLCGIYPDVRLLEGSGDGGVDFRVPLAFTVDVKTARKAVYLLHEKGTPLADIYVLAKYQDDDDDVRLLGWEWGPVLAQAPAKDFGHGVTSHYIHNSQLRPMEQLEKRFYRR